MVGVTVCSMKHAQLQSTALQIASGDPTIGFSVTPAERITAARLVDAIDAGDEAAVHHLAEALNGILLGGDRADV